MAALPHLRSFRAAGSCFPVEAALELMRAAPGLCWLDLSHASLERRQVGGRVAMWVDGKGGWMGGWVGGFPQLCSFLIVLGGQRLGPQPPPSTKLPLLLEACCCRSAWFGRGPSTAKRRCSITF